MRQFLFPHKNDGFTAPATNQTLVCEMHWHVPLSSRLSFVRQFSSRLSFPRQISKTQPFKIVVAADFCVFRCCRQHARCAEWLALGQGVISRLSQARLISNTQGLNLKPSLQVVFRVLRCCRQHARSPDWFAFATSFRGHARCQSLSSLPFIDNGKTTSLVFRTHHLSHDSIRPAISCWTVSILHTHNLYAKSKIARKKFGFS